MSNPKPQFDDYCGEYEYRYMCVNGLERRKISSKYWTNVIGVDFEQMTADELRHCANVMDHAMGKLK